ncbi:hypothetical protein [Aquimarina sediminis]|uniref:hypothetical protein n=1 Tax=Aquimarina sediminis TaxID=2070536 RepID=UPI000CA085C8|nr:hypothetical protein [Aquimarina sediminis]
MKVDLFIMFLLVIVLSQDCQSQVLDFDLYDLGFSEKIDDILKQNNLKLSDGKSDAITLFRYDRFETTDNNLLQFNKNSLVGNSNGQSNNLILHYSIDDYKIAMYEVNLYTDNEVGIISKTLEEKIGTPSILL